MSVSPPHTKMKTINLLETDRNSSGISLDYKKGSAKTTWSSKMEDNQHEKYRKPITWVTPSPSQGQLGSRRVLLRGIYPMWKSRAREHGKAHHCGCLHHLLQKFTMTPADGVTLESYQLHTLSLRL